MNRYALTLLIVAALVPFTHAASPTTLNDVEATVLAAKPQFDAGLTSAIDTVRTATDRSDRMQALRAISENYPSYAAIDQSRAIDILIESTRDSDKEFQGLAIRYIGAVAEAADASNATRIAMQLGQLMEEAKMPMPVEGDGYRADLLQAYARTGGRASLEAGDHADQFISFALQVLREDADIAGSQDKIGAAVALEDFLARNYNELYRSKPAMFSTVGNSLVGLMQSRPFNFTPRSGYAIGADPDLTFRYKIAQTLMLCGGERGSFAPTMSIDPLLSTREHDVLVAMSQSETDPTLKMYLGIHLGQRGI